MQQNSAEQTKIPQEVFYNTKDLAQLFKVSSRTIQNWRDEGKISFTKVDGVIFYTQKDIDELVNNFKQKAFKPKSK